MVKRTGFSLQKIWRCIIDTVQRQSFDALYLERLANGDNETERDFAAYFGELLTIKLRPRLRSVHLIEDVKQETFLRVFKALRQKGTIANPQALGSFVNSVCNNVLFELYRAVSRIADPPEDRPSEDVDAETELVNAEDRVRVRAVLAEMPEKDRTILRWLFFDGRDKNAICTHLGVDREYLRVLVHRAKQRFRTDYLKREKGA
jgi:RNA polymerase sigma-70 factor (ECF subfamily)